MAGMERVRERMAEYLRQRGVEAETAWSDQPRTEKQSPVTVVSLRSCEAGAAGFQDYLGERYNEETGLWEELYGKRAELTLGLDLYAGRGTDGAELQRAFDALTDALAQGGPAGMEVRSFSCGETEYDQRAGRMKRSAQAVCEVWLYAAVWPEGEFLEFEVRGGMKR